MRNVLILAFGAVALLAGCRPAHNVAPRGPVAAEPLQQRIMGGTPADMPGALLYRTNGDFNDNVAITLGADGLPVSYPAPGDVGAFCEPVPMADGWLLDRRGISAASVFTRYTYTQYAALPCAPSPRQLVDSVIPGARVTETYVLPVTLGEALADTATVNSIIREGLK